MTGDAHGVNAAPSSEHSNVAPGSLEEKANVALVSVVYVVQLAVLEPLIVRGEEERLVKLLSIEPGGVLNAVDGLGYAFLCTALFVLIPVFQQGGRDKQQE